MLSTIFFISLFLIYKDVLGTSICDKYTTALLTQNTAANQYTLLKLIVNTVIIGNYTTPNVGVKVPGILATGTYNGETINLLPYFNGSGNTSNVNGIASKVNFLDGGGAAPLLLSEPANDATSNQYFLVTHLYQLFGKLLGCSLQSTNSSGAFPAYSGDASMYQTHKFMNLSANEMGYFIEQVGLAAKSFGVTTTDVTTVADALNSLFNYRCLQPAAVTYSYADTQSICIGKGCSLAASPNCSAYSSDSVTTTQSSGGSSSSSSFPVTSIIAIVVSIGGAILIALIAVAIYYSLQRSAGSEVGSVEGKPTAAAGTGGTASQEMVV